MKFKLTCVASAMFAVASFSASAVTVNGTADASADIAVVADAAVSVIVTPLKDLTVKKVKVPNTHLAKFRVSGDGLLAVAMEGQNVGMSSFCSVVAGKNNQSNSIEVCMMDQATWISSTSTKFNVGGKDYYPVKTGAEYALGSGNMNSSDKVKVNPDIYTVKLNAISYSL